TGDFDRFYPTSVMETGRDILFLWVTRMVMLGLYATGEVPFKNVYLHGMVNDAHGKKMSKSKGNVVNPLEWTERYGTDALRLALTIGITPGNDGALSEKKVEGYRNFNNKLWNVARFILDKAGDDYSPSSPKVKSLADAWIVTKFSRENAAITDAIENYRFSEAGERVYSLLWNDLADWYIEASKTEANLDALVYGLETILKLTHPFAPFVTEAIWQNLPWQSRNLISEPWPEAGERHDSKTIQFEAIMALVSQIRTISSDLKLSKPTLLSKDDLINENRALIKRLARLGEIQPIEASRGLRVPGSVAAWLDIPDADIQNYQKQLASRRSETATYLKKLEAQLQNQAYLKGAPASLVKETKDRAEAAKLLLLQLDEQIKASQ
ncbi:MAG TPA: class I tRNA ligase family protein, partial [Candidatus Saccharimonadia bacterium]